MRKKMMKRLVRRMRRMRRERRRRGRRRRRRKRKGESLLRTQLMSISQAKHPTGKTFSKMSQW